MPPKWNQYWKCCWMSWKRLGCRPIQCCDNPYETIVHLFVKCHPCKAPRTQCLHLCHVTSDAVALTSFPTQSVLLQSLWKWRKQLWEITSDGWHILSEHCLHVWVFTNFKLAIQLYFLQCTVEKHEVIRKAWHFWNLLKWFWQEQPRAECRFMILYMRYWGGFGSSWSLCRMFMFFSSSEGFHFSLGNSNSTLIS